MYVVGSFGGIAPGEQTVIHQHHTLDAWVAPNRLSNLLGQDETRADVLDHRHVLAIDCPEDLPCVLVIGQGNYGVGVGVGDALVGEEGV